MADPAIIKEYLTAGWALVPLVAGQKNPKDNKWRETTYALQDFTEGNNIGVKLGEPSGGLIDFDLDSKEATTLARYLLPETGCIFGRKSKPASHYFFVVPGTKTKVYNGLDGQQMFEVRSTGGQTMLPGSLNPKDGGEMVTWDQHRAPMHLDPKELEVAASRLAVATIVAQNWPSSARHVASGHLGGVLGRCGYSPIEVEETVRAIVIAVGEEQWANDNARYARESAEKLANGEKVSGGPSFRDAFPNGVALLRKIYEFLGREGDEHVDKLNEKHFIVPLGKDMVVATEHPKGIVFQTFNGFEQRYYNVFVGKKKLGKFWLEHERCRKYDELVFAPPPIEVPEGAYNLWRGFACEPLAVVDEAPIARYLHHIHEVICSGNGDHTNYVLDLFAVTVQQPGTPTGKALALRGGQGVGKSVLFKSFGSLFGRRHFMTISSRKHITGEFNAHLSGKVVVFADEAIWGGNRQDVGTLKRLITENTLVIERKGIDSVEELNCMHLFMATNEDWVFPAGDKERRGVIIDVVREQSAEYYRALWAEVKSPAFGPALLAYLQARDVSMEGWRRSLDTSALREQQEMSADLVKVWWKTKLQDGKAGDGVAWPEFVTNTWLYDNFVFEMRAAGGRENPVSFGRKLRKLLPTTSISEVRNVKVNVAPHGLPQWEKRNSRGYAIPNLAECRRFYDSMTGTKEPWEVALNEAQIADPKLMEFDEEDNDL